MFFMFSCFYILSEELHGYSCSCSCPCSCFVLFLFSYSAFDAIQTHNQNKQTTPCFTAQLRSSLRKTTFSSFFLVCQMIDGQTPPREWKTKGGKEKREPNWTLREPLVFPLSLSHAQTHTHTHYSNRVYVRYIHNLPPMKRASNSIHYLPRSCTCKL